MIKVKICGLTRIEDVEWANKLMPDYVDLFLLPAAGRLILKKQVL